MNSPPPPLPRPCACSRRPLNSDVGEPAFSFTFARRSCTRDARSSRGARVRVHTAYASTHTHARTHTHTRSCTWGARSSRMTASWPTSTAPSPPSRCATSQRRTMIRHFSTVSVSFHGPAPSPPSRWPSLQRFRAPRDARRRRRGSPPARPAMHSAPLVSKSRSKGGQDEGVSGGGVWNACPPRFDDDGPAEHLIEPRTHLIPGPPTRTHKAHTRHTRSARTHTNVRTRARTRTHARMHTPRSTRSARWRTTRRPSTSTARRGGGDERALLRPSHIE